MTSLIAFVWLHLILWLIIDYSVNFKGNIYNLEVYGGYVFENLIVYLAI